jgi:chemotaxis protein histidine kinase CheA
MNLKNTVTPLELNNFIKGADQQIQLLDDKTLKLDNAGADDLLIHEMSDIAHGLYLSSETIGYAPMSDLSKTIEMFLVGLSQEHISVNAKMVDSLLNGIDILKALRNQLLADSGQVPDIRAIKSIIQESIHSVPSGSNDIHSALTRNAQNIQEAYRRGESVFLATLSFSPKSRVPAAGCYQSFSLFRQLGHIIWSSPSLMNAREEFSGQDIQVMLATFSPLEKIQTALEAINEVTSISLELVEPGAHHEGQDNTTLNDKSANVGQLSRREHPLVKDERLEAVYPDGSGYATTLNYLLMKTNDLLSDQFHMMHAQRLVISRLENDENVGELTRTSLKILYVISELQQILVDTLTNAVNTGDALEKHATDGRARQEPQGSHPDTDPDAYRIQHAAGRFSDWHPQIPSGSVPSSCVWIAGISK